jgi:hypothetical protein
VTLAGYFFDSREMFFFGESFVKIKGNYVWAFGKIENRQNRDAEDCDNRFDCRKFTGRRNEIDRVGFDEQFGDALRGDSFAG